MAREFGTGFEGGVAPFDRIITGSIEAIPSWAIGGFSGSYCARYLTAYKQLASATERYCHLRVGSYPGQAQDGYLYFYNANQTYWLTMVQISTGNKISVTRHKDLSGGLTDIIATGNTILNTGQVYRIEIYYKPGVDSTGRIIVKINGTVEIDYTGSNMGTYGSWTNTLPTDGIYFYASGGNYYIDDFIVDSAAWVGNKRIAGKLISGAGAYSEFTPSQGANYQNVDEIPASGADYNATNVQDKRDAFTLVNTAVAANSIGAVYLAVLAEQYGAAAVAKMAVGLKGSNGTDYWGSDQAVPQDQWVWLCGIWQNDPATGVAWNPNMSSLNQIQAMYKSRP